MTPHVEVEARRGARAGRACGRGSRRRCGARRRRSRRGPSSSADVGLARLAVDVGACGSWAPILPDAPSTRRARSKPSARAIAAPARRERAPRRRRSGPRHAAAEVARREAARRSAPRRRSAARGWSRRRSRRTPCRRAAPDEQAARASARAARAPRRRRPCSSRCSGANASASAQRASRRRARRRARAPRRVARRRGRARVGDRRRAARRPSLTATAERAVLAVLGLGEQVERDELRRRRPSEATTSSSLGPAKPSMPTSPDDLALGLLHVGVARADDHVDARRSVSVP